MTMILLQTSSLQYGQKENFKYKKMCRELKPKTREAWLDWLAKALTLQSTTEMLFVEDVTEKVNLIIHLYFKIKVELILNHWVQC